MTQDDTGICGNIKYGLQHNFKCRRKRNRDKVTDCHVCDKAQKHIGCKK